MINDGYTQELVVREESYPYRPLPRIDRVRLLTHAKTEDWPLSYIESACRARVLVPIDESVIWEHWQTLLGMTMDKEEKADEENLRVGVWLELRYPHVAKRPCEDCKTWWYEHDTGRIVRRGGKMLKRPVHTKLPCETTGCIKGSPDDPKSLSPKNRLAYQHYLECKATYSFPDDPIVRRNALIIREVEDRWFLDQVRGTVDGRRAAHAGDRQLFGEVRSTGPVLQPGTKPYAAQFNRGSGSTE